MSYIKKIISCFISSVMAFSCFSLHSSLINASSQSLVLPYRFETNLSSIGVYYSDSYAEYYGESTMIAITTWYQDSRTKFMYIKRVDTTRESSVRFHLNSISASNMLAQTTFYYNIEIEPTCHNWTSCKVKVNHANRPKGPTFAHEFGHVLGLNENNSDPSSIMCQESFGRTARKPSASDYTLIAKKYTPYIS
ncbi:hypothetical protein [Ruminococcus sp.]